MKIAINGSLICNNEFFPLLINTFSEQGDNIYIVFDENLSKNINAIIKNSDLKFYSTKKFNKENKYKIYQINNFSYIIDNDINLLNSNIRSMFSEYCRFCIVDYEDSKKIYKNTVVNLSCDEIHNDIIAYKQALQKHIEDPVTVLSGNPSTDKPWSKSYSIDQLNVNLPNMNVWEYLYLSNYNNFEGLAIRYFGYCLTYKEMFEKVNEYARCLISDGVTKDDIITICMPNTPEAVTAFLAVNKIGAIANMVHPLLKSHDIKDSFDKTASKYLIMADICYPEISKIINEIELDKVVVVSPSNSMPIISNIQFGIKFLYNTKEFIKKIRYRSSLKKLKNKHIFSSNDVLQSNDIYKQQIINLEALVSNIPYGNVFVKWNDEIKRSKKQLTDLKVPCVYSSNRTAVLLRTGGTTGKSKLAELSNENIIANTSQLRCSIPSYKEGDGMLAISPIFHGFGLVDSIITAMGVNMSVDLHPQFNKMFFVKSLIKNKPTIILGVPTLWKYLITHNKLSKKRDLSFAKVWISGGDVLPNELAYDVNNWRKAHRADNPIFSGIGMTEATAAIAFTGLKSAVDSSVGFPLPCNIVKIINEDGDECKPFEHGELCVTGPTVMNRYYNNIVDTNNSLIKDSNGRVWYHSGDICYLSDNGEIVFVGRKKNVIIVSGVNVYGSEIEPIISEINEVETCAVVKMPHDSKMNVPMAYVVLKDNILLSEELKKKIMVYVNSKLDVYHRIYDIAQIDSIPVTPLNKTDYRKLQIMSNKKYDESND